MEKAIEENEKRLLDWAYKTAAAVHPIVEEMDVFNDSGEYYEEIDLIYNQLLDIEIDVQKLITGLEHLKEVPKIAVFSV